MSRLGFAERVGVYARGARAMTPDWVGFPVGLALSMAFLSWRWIGGQESVDWGIAAIAGVFSIWSVGVALMPVILHVSMRGKPGAMPSRSNALSLIVCVFCIWAWTYPVVEVQTGLASKGAIVEAYARDSESLAGLSVPRSQGGAARLEDVRSHGQVAKALNCSHCLEKLARRDGLGSWPNLASVESLVDLNAAAQPFWMLPMVWPLFGLMDFLCQVAWGKAKAGVARARAWTLGDCRRGVISTIQAPARTVAWSIRFARDVAMRLQRAAFSDPEVRAGYEVRTAGRRGGSTPRDRR